MGLIQSQTIHLTRNLSARPLVIAWMTLFSVVPRDFMVFTPFSHVLLHLLITLLGLRLGLVVLRATIFSMSLVLCVGASFSLLRL